MSYKTKAFGIKIYRFITKFKKMAIVNHLVSFRSPNFMQRVNFKFLRSMADQRLLSVMTSAS